MQAIKAVLRRRPREAESEAGDSLLAFVRQELEHDYSLSESTKEAILARALALSNEQR